MATAPLGTKTLDTETEAPIRDPKPTLNVADGGVHFKDLDELYRFCQLVAKTDFIPAIYQNNPEKCLCAIQYGMEIGMKAMMALKSIMVVNGVPSVWGDGLLAICQGSPSFDWSRWREYSEGTPFDDSYHCVCVCARIGQTTPRVSTFSVADAKRADLWSHAKKLYGKYPQRMLQMRARSPALRDTFAVELGGMACAEEMQHNALVEEVLDGIDTSSSEAIRNAMSTPPPDPPEPSAAEPPPAEPAPPATSTKAQPETIPASPKCARCGETDGHIKNCPNEKSQPEPAPTPTGPISEDPPLWIANKGDLKANQAEDDNRKSQLARCKILSGNLPADVRQAVLLKFGIGNSDEMAAITDSNLLNDIGTSLAEAVKRQHAAK